MQGLGVGFVPSAMENQPWQGYIPLHIPLSWWLQGPERGQFGFTVPFSPHPYGINAQLTKLGA